MCVINLNLHVPHHNDPGYTPKCSRKPHLRSPEDRWNSKVRQMPRSRGWQGGGENNVPLPSLPYQNGPQPLAPLSNLHPALTHCLTVTKARSHSNKHRGLHRM